MCSDTLFYLTSGCPAMIIDIVSTNAVHSSHTLYLEQKEYGVKLQIPVTKINSDYEYRDERKQMGLQ